MPRPRNDRVPAILVVGLILAVGGIHAALAFVIEGAMRWGGADRPLPETDQMMDVELIPLEQAAEDQKDEELARELVDNEMKSERAPEDAKRIAEFDAAPTRETVRHAPKKDPQHGSPAAGSPSEAGELGQDKAGDDKSKSAAMGDKGEGAAQRNPQTQVARGGEMASEEGSSGKRGSPVLQGSREALAQAFGTPGTIDYDEDVDEGASTFLEAKQNKFASFFNRVRNSTAQEWEPEVILAARDPEGRKYGSKTRTTRLLITLNKDGSLHKATVDRPCGVDFLDEEAIRAIKVAAPFTNPPAGLIDPKSDKIEFTFSFIVLIDGSKSIRRFRR